MDNLSTNELQHFTKSIDVLIKILNNGFIASFCCETYFDNKNYWLPMVSFCDIPANLADQHKQCYGEYVIAMKRQWRRTNNLHPVHYIWQTETEQEHSLLSSYNCLKSTYMNLISDDLEKIEQDFILTYNNCMPLETLPFITNTIKIEVLIPIGKMADITVARHFTSALRKIRAQYVQKCERKMRFLKIKSEHSSPLSTTINKKGINLLQSIPPNT